MQYSGYYNTQDIREGLPVRLEELLEFSDYIVNGQHCALKSSTLDPILLFIYRVLSQPTGEFTGPSVGHNYLRKNVTNIPIDALDRSPCDLSIGL